MADFWCWQEVPSGSSVFLTIRRIGWDGVCRAQASIPSPYALALRVAVGPWSASATLRECASPCVAATRERSHVQRDSPLMNPGEMTSAFTPAHKCCLLVPELLSLSNQKWHHDIDLEQIVLSWRISSLKTKHAKTIWKVNIYLLTYQPRNWLFYT